MAPTQWIKPLLVAAVIVGGLAAMAYLVTRPTPRPIRPALSSHGLLCHGFDPWQTISTLEGADIYRIELKHPSVKYSGYGRPSEVFETVDEEHGETLEMIIPEDIVFVDTKDLKVTPTGATPAFTSDKLAFLHSVWLQVQRELAAGTQDVYVATEPMPDFDGGTAASADSTLLGSRDDLRLAGPCNLDGKANLNFDSASPSKTGDELITSVINGELTPQNP